MATREMKTRFKLEGEQAFKKAMSDAAAAVRVLNSEQKLAAAEFEASGDAQQYAADQARILKQKIEEQKKAVQAAEEAVAQLTKNGVEPNSRQMQQWKTKLNDAKASLAKMETQLGKTEAEIKDQNSVLGKAKTAVTEAESKVKALNDEEKLAEAQFEATGNKEQYAANKTNILRQKIDEQKKVVAAAELAIQSMTDNGVDPASEEMQAWKNKLVTAKTQLAQMETQLNNTEAELKDQNSVLGKAKTAMSETEQKVKALNDEEKLAEAQFQATGNKEQYAANKTRILKDKIEEQKKAVEIAEAAIKAMTDEGVDPASEEMQEWKGKLVAAKTQLAQMETQLNKTESELKDQNSALGTAKTKASDAESKFKSLTAEEKLAEAQFKATGDKEKYLADKTRILKEKIEEQQKVVEASEAAIKSLTDNGVDPNSREVQEWRDKLVTAKTSLLNLQNRLDHVGDEVGEETEAFGEAEGSADDLRSAIEKVGEDISYQNVKDAIDSITGHIEDVVKTAARAAKAIWEMGVDAGQWADDLSTAANEAGVDVETYQSWMYASRFIDTSVDDIVRSWQDIQKNMKEGNTEYLATLAGMGIASRTAKNQVRSSEAIFWDAIDYLHGISDETLRAEKATLLFGSDWRKMNPLIEAGSQAYKDMAQEGMSVAVVSQKNVEALGEVDDAVQDFESRFDKMKYDALAALAPTFKLIAEAMSQAVTALDEFVESEEGQAALAGLNEALSGLIKAFLGDDNGRGTFEAIVNAAKDAVTHLTDALGWISEHGAGVKDAILALGAAWATLKVAGSVLTFLQLAKSLPTGKLSSLANIFGSAGGNAAASSAVTGGTSALGGGATAAVAGGTGATVGTAMNATVLANAMAGLVPLGVFAAGVIPAIIAQDADNRRTAEKLAEMSAAAESAALDAGEAGAEAKAAADVAIAGLGLSGKTVYGQDIYSDAAKVASSLDTIAGMGDLAFLSGESQLMLDRYQKGLLSAQDTNALLWKVAQEAVDYLESPGEASGGTDISDTLDQLIELKEMLEEDPAGSEGGLYGTIRSLAEDKDVLAALSDETRDLVGAWLDPESGFGSGSATVFSDSMDLLDRMMEDLQDTWDKTHAAGASIPDGMAAGINDNAGAAEDAAADMADGTVDAARGALDIHSPSGVFEVIGQNVSVGLANGIYKRADDAINAALWLAKSVENIVCGALQIHSPSKVFERIGSFTGEGFAEGIEGTADRVSRAVGVMVGATARRPAMAFGGVDLPASSAAQARVAGMETDAAGTVHVTMVLDKEVLGDVMAPIVNDKIGAKINATRR